MKSFRRLAIVLSTAVGLALLISACGGGDEGVSTGSGSAESEAKEVESVEAAQAEVTADVDQSEYTLKQPEGPPGIKLTSASITSGSLLPVEATCQGEDKSPHLRWTGAPEGTQSFAIVFEDRDADDVEFVHWVAYSIPSTVTEIQEGAPAGTLDNGIKQGINDSGNVQYNGPCPPPIVKYYTASTGSGLPHRYYFKVYALDTAINLQPGVNKYGLLRKMDGHILATGELMRRFVSLERGGDQN